MQDELTMKQRLRNAVKMAQERIAVQGHAYDVEEFMRDVPAPPIISGEVVPTESTSQVTWIRQRWEHRRDSRARSAKRVASGTTSGL